MMSTQPHILIQTYTLLHTHTHTHTGRPTLRGFSHGGAEAVHVVASVTVVTEQQLVVVLRGATQAAGFALDTLPAVGPDSRSHVHRELQTGRVTWGGVHTHTHTHTHGESHTHPHRDTTTSTDICNPPPFSL